MNIYIFTVETAVIGCVPLQKTFFQNVLNFMISSKAIVLYSLHLTKINWLYFY